jgi:hypothetical protein
MATQRQIDANRRNATASTGPRTAEGKSTVSANALRHGLRAQNPFLSPEDEEEFETLNEGLLTEFDPQTEVERSLLRRLAREEWRSRLADRTEDGIVGSTLDGLAMRMEREDLRLLHEDLDSITQDTERVKAQLYIEESPRTLPQELHSRYEDASYSLRTYLLGVKHLQFTLDMAIDELGQKSRLNGGTAARLRREFTDTETSLGERVGEFLPDEMRPKKRTSVSDALRLLTGERAILEKIEVELNARRAVAVERARAVFAIPGSKEMVTLDAYRTASDKRFFRTLAELEFRQKDRGVVAAKDEGKATNKPNSQEAEPRT